MLSAGLCFIKSVDKNLKNYDKFENCESHEILERKLWFVLASTKIKVDDNLLGGRRVVLAIASKLIYFEEKKREVLFAK